MRPEAARNEAAATGCGHLRHRMDGLMDTYAALMADVAADLDRPELARRMSRLIGALHATRAAVAGHALGDTFADESRARDLDYRPQVPAPRLAVVRPLFPVILAPPAGPGAAT